MDSYGILIREIGGQDCALSEVRRATGRIAKEFSDWNSIMLDLPIESDTPLQAAVLGFVRVIVDAIENTRDKEEFLSPVKVDIPEMRQERYIMGDGSTPNIVKLLRQYDTGKIKWGSFSLGTAQFVGEESNDPSDHDNIAIEVSFLPTAEDGPTYYHLDIRKTDTANETSDRSRKQQDESELPPVSSEESSDQFSRPFARIYQAWYLENKRYQENPPQPDMFAEFTAVSAWSIVTCCYSGIEQAMKCLLQLRGTYVDESLRKGGHRHHDVSKLFRALASDEQDVVRDSYAIYRSLHEYIPPETADDFLNAIDRGYPAWRYFLLEGNDQSKWPPTTHPGAMLEIWFTLCQIMRTKDGINLEIDTVNQNIRQRLWHSLKDAYDESIPLLERHSRDGEGLGNSELSELYSWLNGYDNNLINACSDLIYAHAKGNVEYTIRDFAPTTRVILLAFLDNVEGDESYRREEVRLFIRRAKETRIRWDQEARRFVS